MAEQGGCLCGNIRYQTNAPPQRVTICHCRFCQRATGSAYMVEPIFDAAAFVLNAGKPKVFARKSAGSGKMVNVHFCDICGTKIFLSFERWANIVGIYAGTFDDPNWFERTPTNARHIFLGVAQKGTVIPAGFPTFVEHVTTADDVPNAPQILDAAMTIGARN